MSSASTTEASTTSSSPASSINVNNAPKYGTLVPNRIFVGGISANTTESELAQLFSAYGNVKATKIISDRAGVSKGYGFVTFETEEEAKRLQREADCITLKERKLNIAPAIKKQQPYSRSYEATPAAPSNTVFYQNGVPYTYHNGMAFFTAAPDTYAFPQPQAAYPMMYPQPMYVPHQYQYQAVPPSSPVTSQYMYTSAPSPMTIPGTTPPVLTTHGPGPTYYPSTPVPPPQQGLNQEMFTTYGQPNQSFQADVYEPPPLDTSVTQSSEDSSSNSSREKDVSGAGDKFREPQNKNGEESVKLEAGTGWTKPHVPPPTPIVSLLKLQMCEEQDSSTVSHRVLTKKAPPSNHVFNPTNKQRRYASPRKPNPPGQAGRPGQHRGKFIAKTVNGVQVITAEKMEDAMGGAGDAPPLAHMPMTPPATPHSTMTSSGGMNREVTHIQTAVQESVCQMQALSL